jgi:hypothetical protein
MEFRARVMKGVFVPNEPTQLPEGKEVLLSLVEVSDEPPQKSELESLLDQMEVAYDELAELLSQRTPGSKDPGLEAQITAKQDEIAHYKKQRTQKIEEALKQRRSAVNDWEETLAEAKKYAKETHETSPSDTNS